MSRKKKNKQTQGEVYGETSYKAISHPTLKEILSMPLDRRQLHFLHPKLRMGTCRSKYLQIEAKKSNPEILSEN